MTLNIHRYTPDMQTVWDSFVEGSKNGAFMFQRAYQDYHADRFEDHSYLFFRNDEVIALLPASREGDELSSHGGLTFGGILSNERMTTPLMLDLFQILVDRLKLDGVRRFVYKASPAFYHSLPSDEDLYALNRFGAKLFRRDVGSVLRPNAHPAFQTRRKRSVKKAERANIEFCESNEFSEFWQVLTNTLDARHGVQPVHSLAEIERLKADFNSNIRLFVSTLDNQVLAGTVIYENSIVAHTQYIASSPEGRDVGALDLIFSELINRVFNHKPWFSFGISTESAGMVLAKGLVEQKEGFGARAAVQDFYELSI